MYVYILQKFCSVFIECTTVKSSVFKIMIKHSNNLIKLVMLIFLKIFQSLRRLQKEKLWRDDFLIDYLGRIITVVFLRNRCNKGFAALSTDFSVISYSELLGADNWTERSGRVRHKSFNLLHCARDTGQQLYTISRHCNVVFNANLHTVVI